MDPKLFFILFGWLIGSGSGKVHENEDDDDTFTNHFDSHRFANNVVTNAVTIDLPNVDAECDWGATCLKYNVQFGFQQPNHHCTA